MAKDMIEYFSLQELINKLGQGKRKVRMNNKKMFFYRCNKKSCPVCACACAGIHADKYKRWQAEFKIEELPCFVGPVTPVSFKHSVQIIDNDSIHKRAEKRYPNLYAEVMRQDRVCNSSWYDFSDTAFEEFKKFKRFMIRKGIWGQTK